MMHVIVVGAGAAGLGAAWALMEAGVDVTVLESSDQAGGRCRTTYWHGEWRITGALAFVSIEDNLKDQARKLGIYADEYLEDMSGLHEHRILVDRKDIISIPDFEPFSILKCSAIPVHEKLALARLLPRLVRQSFKNDWRNPTTAAVDDFETACGYLRKYSPTFVEYLLEPIMQHFNGFSEDDYSLGWIVWLLAGAPWSSSWWTFKERGVGKLTHEMAEQLAARSNVDFRYGAEARQIRHAASGAEVDILIDGNEQTVKGDAVVCAVPGQMVNGLVSELDGSYRKFFESVRYGALYLSYFLVSLPRAELPDAVILPTADGFETTAYYNIQPVGTDGMAIVHAEMKGEASSKAASMSDDEVRDALWADVVAATPAMQGCEIRDFMLVRNDIAIVKPYVGYLRALESFRQLAPIPRLAFAGDYLVTSTVGQAHYTGLQAAKQLLGQ